MGLDENGTTVSTLTDDLFSCARPIIELAMKRIMHLCSCYHATVILGIMMLPISVEL
jgi:hypothetical protein